MKFQPESSPGVNLISRQEPGRVWVGAARYESSVLVPWSGAVRGWAVTAYAELTPTHFESILALQPEVVIFGSGGRLRFAPPQWLRALIERRIGFEAMDTAAACRTYNVLAVEGRAVVGALLLEAPAPPPAMGRGLPPGR
jgi:uncharacterized protein